MPDRKVRSFNRRRFLAAGAALAGSVRAPLGIAASSMGRGSFAAPSDRITLGFIGIGMMGRGHLGLFSRNPETQILAVCDVDSWRRENALNSVKAAYSRFRKRGHRECAAYNDLRDLLARDEIDAVVIATGDRWHVPAGVLAAKAGKDVYCEKPMSLTIREARTMTETARRYGTIFQVGLQQRSDPVFRTACELVRSGRLGRLRSVYVAFPGTSTGVNLPPEPVPRGLDWDLWLGPAPWRPFSRRFHHYGQPKFVVPWHICPDFGGGNLTSNAVHSFDVVQWALGTDGSGPVEITPPGVNGVPSLTYRYANSVILQVTWRLEQGKHPIPKGWNPATRLQPFGALFVGEEGWIHVGRRGFLDSYPPGIVKKSEIPEPEGNPVGRHHRNWLQSIRTRRLPACDVAIGASSVIVSHLGCIALRTGRALSWDPVKEEFADDNEANRMRTRAFRGPWRL